MYEVRQYRTKARPRTPVSHAASLHNCRGPFRLQCAQPMCPHAGLCLTPGQSDSPSFRGRMDLLLHSRPEDPSSLGDPTPHIRDKEENRLLRIRASAEVQKTHTVPGTGSGRQLE